ncbi:MAG: peptidoglycan editing factor PgeF [Actinomycetota bacterium]|nr:peptidoglycan editing factor PgeF [Actinomycetota bacterium]
MAFDLLYKERGDIKFLTSPKLLDEASILVMFSTRMGGVSPSPYNSLNLAFDVGDKWENVIKNRRMLCLALGLDAASFTTAEQTHENRVAQVNEDSVGQGAFGGIPIPGVDALVTNLNTVSLALFFADCVPIAIVDPIKRVIGIAHAGWKGTYLGISSNLANLMMSRFNCQASNLLVFMGPCIGPCCYWLESTKLDRFKREFPRLMEVHQNGSFDLEALNIKQLEGVGIPRQNIYSADICTSCNTDLFFSYHAENCKTGRQAGLVALL